MKRLVGFSWNCGRSGTLSGRFVLDDCEWERLTEAAHNGEEVYFGEVLGKHSEICGNLEPGDIRLITDNQEFIEMAGQIGVDLSSGYNPLDYLGEDEEE